MSGFLAENLMRFLEGALMTVQLSALSCALGFMIAVPVALARLSSDRAQFSLATAYVFFFRGTPLLAQIFLIYYGSGQFRPELDALGLWAFFRDPWFCAVLALSLNNGAYTSEILRGSIAAVPIGEVEAARALGLKAWMRLWLVILPRAIRIGWSAYSNQVVYQIQATSLVSVITMMDITGVARSIGARDFTFYEAFGLAAVLYIFLIYCTILVSRRIERHLNAYLGASPAPSPPFGTDVVP